MHEDLVTRTSRDLARSIERYVAEVAEFSPSAPNVDHKFVRNLVGTTSTALCHAVDEFVNRVVGGGASPQVEPASIGFANLVLEPAVVATIMKKAAERFGLSQRESDVLTASLCGIPRRHLGRVLAVTENTIKTTVRHAIQKTGHQNLDDAVWWLRMRSGQPREGRRAG